MTTFPCHVTHVPVHSYRNQKVYDLGFFTTPFLQLFCQGWLQLNNLFFFLLNFFGGESRASHNKKSIWSSSGESDLLSFTSSTPPIYVLNRDYLLSCLKLYILSSLKVRLSDVIFDHMFHKLEREYAAIIILQYTLHDKQGHRRKVFKLFI